jgi:alpha-L-rhamnosidase
MGDAQIFVRTSTFNMDVASFFTKWMRDVSDAQAASGAFSEVSPNPDWQVGTPAWGDAGLIVPWQIYLSYGDTRILAEHYAAMARWVAYIQAANPGFLWLNQRGSNYGDWESDDSAQTDKDMLSTAFYAQSVDIMRKAAQLLGKQDDAQEYARLFENIRAAFQAEYVDAQGNVRSGTQTAYALALRFGLLPDALSAQAVQHFVDDVQARKHITAGFVGVAHILPALTLGGRTDVAYELLNVDTFPSWLYEVKMGATTIWERWDGMRPDGSLPDDDNPTMNSFNHYAFGAVGEWLYANVLGIAADEAAPGFAHFIVQPRPGGGLTWARGSLDSMRGTIGVDWKLEDGLFTLELDVPVNARAHVRMPYLGEVRESGSALEPDATGLYPVESGHYTFSARAP